ncbi:hypothetical protein BV20DRAFT_576660 [Pilatotrama ljubarskyi]|nr:hypothetical protein BV20DRAFT_576660 [Pilatotrama ljubarskyi]
MGAGVAQTMATHRTLDACIAGRHSRGTPQCCTSRVWASQCRQATAQSAGDQRTMSEAGASRQMSQRRQVVGRYTPPGEAVRRAGKTRRPPAPPLPHSRSNHPPSSAYHPSALPSPPPHKRSYTLQLAIWQLNRSHSQRTSPTTPTSPSPPIRPGTRKTSLPFLPLPPIRPCRCIDPRLLARTTALSVPFTLPGLCARRRRTSNRRRPTGRLSPAPTVLSEGPESRAMTSSSSEASEARAIWTSPTPDAFITRARSPAATAPRPTTRMT